MMMMYMMYLNIIPIFIIIVTTTAFPIPQHLHPKLPTIPYQPALQIHETYSDILIQLSHPILNTSTTARITLSSNPLTVHISPPFGRPLIRRIPLQKTFNNVTILGKPGMVEVILHKTVPDVETAIQACLGKEHGCLARLVNKVCLREHIPRAMKNIPCAEGCMTRVLKDCQRPDMLSEGADFLTRMVFVVVAGIMVVSFAWGFASAIVSIPKELLEISVWLGEILATIGEEGVLAVKIGVGGLMGGE